MRAEGSIKGAMVDLRGLRLVPVKSHALGTVEHPRLSHSNRHPIPLRLHGDGFRQLGLGDDHDALLGDREAALAVVLQVVADGACPAGSSRPCR